MDETVVPQTFCRTEVSFLFTLILILSLTVSNVEERKHRNRKIIHLQQVSGWKFFLNFAFWKTPTNLLIFGIQIFDIQLEGWRLGTTWSSRSAYGVNVWSEFGNSVCFRNSSTLTTASSLIFVSKRSDFLCVAGSKLPCYI